MLQIIAWLVMKCKKKGTEIIEGEEKGDYSKEIYNGKIVLLPMNEKKMKK